MLLSPYAFINTVIRLLGLTLVLKIPITIVVAVVAIPMAIYPRPVFGKVLQASLIMAVVGSVAFTVISLLPGLIGLLLAVIVYWVIVSTVLDRHFEVHYDQSYAITGQIVIASMALWILCSLAIMAIQMAGRQ